MAEGSDSGLGKEWGEDYVFSLWAEKTSMLNADTS